MFRTEALKARLKIPAQHLLEWVGPRLKIARRTYDPDRHRLFVEVYLKGRVPADALELTTTSGRRLPADRIFCTSKPGAWITRWSAEFVVPSLVSRERIVANVMRKDGTIKSKTRGIRARVPKHMRGPKLPSPPPRDTECRLSETDLDRLRALLVNADAEELSPTVSYFPKFDEQAAFSNHFHRASWYLTGAATPVKRVVFGLSEIYSPGSKPAHFCSADADTGHFKSLTDDTDYEAELTKSKVILIWKDIDPEIVAALKRKHPGREVLTVSTGDMTAAEYGAYCSVSWRILDQGERARSLARSAGALQARLEQLRSSGADKAVVFGTGPSIEASLEFDFSDCITIVCNSAITSPQLMDHIRPSFVTAGDVVSHFGVSTYAERFRQDLFDYLRNNDVLFFTTSTFGYLLEIKYPELANKIVYAEQRSEGAVTDLENVFTLPLLDSTFNIHMLPLAATISDTIYILGCDGKDPDPDENEDFWPHSSLAQYHELVETGHLSHPTFDLNRQRSTHDRYLASVEVSCLGGEVLGKRYMTLKPSFTPPLAARPIPPHMASVGPEGRIQLQGDKETKTAGRRVLLVSRASPAHFSGGRYHALLMAESLAVGGDEVVLWLDNMPRWYHNLALLEGHHRITLHLDSHKQAPPGDFDVVIVVPDHTPNPDLYLGALSVARATGAVTALINFESPNWFNAMTPAPKPLDNWQYWYATGAYSDAILSLADVGTEYARDYYDQAPASCLIKAANPVINSRAADYVRAKNVKAGKQIISISRFGKGTEHKNVKAITSLLSEATRGHTLALIVGTGAYPSNEEIKAIEDGLAPFDMSLKLLHNISDIQKFEEIAKSRVMIFQSLFEGFGYPPIEAQYMDRPCVAYDLPVLREFSDGAIDFVPLSDEAAMAKTLADVLARPLPEDGGLRSRLLDFATPEAMGLKMDAILNEALTRPRAAENFEAADFLAIAKQHPRE